MDDGLDAAALTSTTSSAPAAHSPALAFGVAAAVGGLVALSLGVYGRVHDPASESTIKWFFTSTLNFKVWMTTLALALALLQVLGGLWMFGRLPLGPAPAWVGPAHRMSGSLALLATLPVAYPLPVVTRFDPDPGGGRRLVALRAGLPLLRGVRHEGDRRALAPHAGLGAARRRWRAVRHPGADLVHQLAVVHAQREHRVLTCCARSPPSSSSSWPSPSSSPWCCCSPTSRAPHRRRASVAGGVDGCRCVRPQLCELPRG